MPTRQAKESAIPRAQKKERNAAFSRLREAFGFSEHDLQAFAKEANCTCLADHLDAVTAQTLATRCAASGRR